MKTGWAYYPSTSEIGEQPDEPLADRAAGREHPSFETPAAPVTVPAGNFPGGQPAGDQLRSVRYWAEQANAKSCWMCGIRLPADQMVADGGSACHDLRWYCQDTWACTGRWTSRPATPAATGEDTAETPETPGEQATGADAAQPVPVYDWPLTRRRQITRV